jgi:hypothetical protein
MRHSRIASLTIALAAVIFTPITQAKDTQVTMIGQITSVNSQQSDNTGIKLGDPFSFSFTYADTEQMFSQRQVNFYDIFDVVTAPVRLETSKWIGTLPNAIFEHNAEYASPALTAGSIVQAIYRHSNSELLEREWRVTTGIFSNAETSRGFDLYFITDYGNTPGYGWWSIGGTAYGGGHETDLSFGNFTINQIYATSPIPEPSAVLYMGVGLALIAGKRQFARHMR